MWFLSIQSKQNRARRVLWRIPRRVCNKFDSVKNLSNSEFRRLTGVKKETFKKMSEILQEESLKKMARGGRDSKLGIENMLLMTLEYLREYRTYFHIGQAYGISESNSYRIIKWVEDTLIKSRVFSCKNWSRCLHSQNVFTRIYVVVFLVFGSKYSSNFS